MSAQKNPTPSNQAGAAPPAPRNARQPDTAHHSASHLRFDLWQRLEHAILILSFTTLAITGLPQKFSANAISEAIIAVFGGIELIRQIHHIAAILMVAQSIYHVAAAAYRIFVLRVSLTMLPGIQDAKDILAAMLYDIGKRPQPPRFGRYNYGEKMEYWAMVWGTLLMAFTGFMLWNPIAATRLLPGEIIPAAKAAHGAEAILAVSAIILWHFYNVHLKTFNKSMFNGHLTEHQMQHEHPAELELITAGKATRPVNRQVIQKRRQVFIPIAGIVALALLVGLYSFATFEATAITTLPYNPDRQAPFAPLTPTPTSAHPPPAQTPLVSAAMIPHGVEGWQDCLACHQAQLPADHAGRPNESCTACHKPDEVVVDIPPIPHVVEGRENCLACHEAQLPASHAGRGNDSCVVCHQPAPAQPGTTPSADIRDIPHAVGGLENCLACHETGVDKAPPIPANHAGRSNNTCTACHKPPQAPPASTPSTGDISGIPHAVLGGDNCLACHTTGIGKAAKMPDDHIGRSNDACTACHTPLTP